MNMTTNDNTVMLVSPETTARMTLEFLEDVEQYYGQEILKDVLLKAYRSVTNPQYFGKHISIKKHIKEKDNVVEKTFITVEFID
jgi:uncharacterized protein YktA (UPF0223 family)